MATVNLRKANAIQNNLGEAVREYTMPNTSLDILFNDHWQADVISRAAEHALAIETINRIQDIRTYLRSSIADANHDVGINSILSAVSGMERKIDFLENLLKYQDEREENSVVERKRQIKLQNVDKQPETHSFSSRMMDREMSYNVSIFDASWKPGIKKEIKLLKQQRQAQLDKVLELNVRTTIHIDNDMVQFLNDTLTISVE